MNTKAIKDANELTKQLLKNRTNLVAAVIFEDVSTFSSDLRIYEP